MATTMLEPNYMSLPSAAALPVTRMGFSYTAKKRLLSHGIASALQLAEIASRNPRWLRDLTGVSGTKARKMLEAELGVLPDFANTATTFNPLPPAGVPFDTKGRDAASAAAPRYCGSGRLEAHLSGLTDLPSRVFLMDRLFPVGDQGPWGTCVGWAANAVREFAMQQPMSPGYAYRGAKLRDGFAGAGTWLKYAMEHLFTVGHVAESDYPYRAAVRADPIDHLVPQASGARSLGWAYLDRTRTTTHLPKLMRTALSGRLTPNLGPQPIAVSLALYPSFTMTSTALDGLIPMPFPDEECRGGHAMCVVGYIDAEDPRNPFGISYFVTRNSWGTAWAGESPFNAPGHAMIPEAYFAKRKNVLEAVICLGGNI